MGSSKTLLFGAVTVACVFVVTAGAAWWLDNSMTESTGQVVAGSEAQASGPAVGPAATTETAAPIGEFPIMKASTPVEVREVLRITRESTADDRDALRAAALRSTDPLVVGNAVKALGRLKLVSSDPELLALTADSRKRVRQDAIKACGMDGGLESLPYLEKALATDDASLRPLVIQSLGEIGGSRARALVAAVAADADASATDRVFAQAALDRKKTGR